MRHPGANIPTTIGVCWSMVLRGTALGVCRSRTRPSEGRRPGSIPGEGIPAGPISPRVCRAHGGLRSRRAGSDSRAGDCAFFKSSECDGFAYDPAKVEDQVQFLARTFTTLTLKPDGQATGCNPVLVGSTPTGVFMSIAEIGDNARERSRSRWHSGIRCYPVATYDDP
jgi:hypothetical protein